jgi:hypothetical protein
MTNLKWVCILNLLCNSVVIAQVSEQPFKGANTIIIATDNSSDQAYQDLGRTLVAQGYSIDVNNKEFYQMRTAYKGIGSYMNLQYQITASIDDGLIIIRPQINMGPPLGVQEWTYTKAKMSKNWVVQNEILENLGALGKVYYQKRN